MENTLGEFALSKINDVLNFSNEVVRANNEDNKGELDKYRQVYKIKKEEYKFIYQNIGEDYLKSIVGNHIEILEEALDVGDFIDAKIEKYQHEIEKLKSLKDAENKIRK